MPTARRCGGPHDERDDREDQPEQQRVGGAARRGRHAERPDPPRSGVQRAWHPLGPPAPPTHERAVGRACRVAAHADRLTQGGRSGAHPAARARRLDRYTAAPPRPPMSPSAASAPRAPEPRHRQCSHRWRRMLRRAPHRRRSGRRRRAARRAPRHRSRRRGRPRRCAGSVPSSVVASSVAPVSVDPGPPSSPGPADSTAPGAGEGAGAAPPGCAASTGGGGAIGAPGACPPVVVLLRAGRW